MKRTLHVILTLFALAGVSRFLVRLVDATVQIGDDVWLLILFLLLANGLLGYASYRLYQWRERKGK